RDLVPEPVPDEMMEVLDFAPGAAMAGTPHLPGTREFFTCLDGRVNLMVAGERHALATGDVLAFPGNLPHSYQNADALVPARGVPRIIDVFAVLPTWAALFCPALHVLIDVRPLRLLRLFRILKLAEYVDEYGALGRALMASRRKILVFLSFVLLVVVVMGTILYVVEGPENGFTNVPVSVYWAISTMTTVGYGDITPKTGLGRFIASLMMLIGWGTLAVPTGIVTAEITALRFAGDAPGRA